MNNINKQRKPMVMYAVKSSSISLKNNNTVPSHIIDEDCLILHIPCTYTNKYLVHRLIQGNPKNIIDGKNCVVRR